MDKLTTQKGFSIIEILIAMAIGIIVISGVVAGSGGFSLALRGNQSTILNGQTNAEAVTKAQQLVEQEQALGRQDFNLVNPTGPTTDGIYTKNVTVTTQPDLLTKSVTTVISWVGDHGQALSTTLSTLVTNLENVNSPNTCNSAMSNPDGWKNPQDTSFDFQQLLYGNLGNGLSLSDVDALNKKLYVTASAPPSNPTDFQTFFVLDISNPSQPPQFRGFVDNNTNSDDGMDALAVASTTSKIYAFVANAHDANFKTCKQGQSCSQLQVIDATNPFSPSVVSSGNYLLSTSTAPYVLGNVTSSSGQAVGKSLYYKDGYLYLGLTTTSNGPGFHIIDVGNGTYGGTPTNPKWVSSWPNNSSNTLGASGAPINAIYVKNGYAYLAHPDGLTGAPSEELTVLDVSNPANPVRVGSYSHATGVGGNGKSMMLIGNTLYLGRTASNISGSADSIPEFYILNDTDPTAIPSTAVGSTTLTTAESVNTLVVRDFLAFLLTTTEFKVVDISSPASISAWGSIPLAGDGGSAFDCEDDRFFIIHDVNKDHVSVVTPSNQVNPTVTTEIHNSTHAVVTTVAANTAVHDKATVSGSAGTPTGTVDFTYYADGTCSTGATSAGMGIALVSGVAHPSSSETPSTVGTYSFRAHYNGDSNYNSIDGVCEPLTVTGAFAYTLSASPASKTLLQGSSYTETITATKISGSAQPVTVSLAGFQNNVSYAPLTATCTPNPSCPLSFTITAAANGQKVTRTITATGSAPATTTTFSLTVQ